MRISKEPEVRKREIADNAMRLFCEKGYEATSMKDIARAVNVVPVSAITILNQSMNYMSMP